eukprot:Rhum_TRINITY_DN10975_c0_g3::Rhum_TRINITY_DN10975_c0_g3_i1::g.41574::m.41574
MASTAAGTPVPHAPAPRPAFTGGKRTAAAAVCADDTAKRRRTTAAAKETPTQTPPDWFHADAPSHFEASHFVGLSADTYLSVRNGVLQLAEAEARRGDGYCSVLSAVTNAVGHDAATVTRVHAFLEQHRLINAGVETCRGTVLEGRDAARFVCEPPSLAYADTPAGLVPSLSTRPFTETEQHTLLEALAEHAWHLHTEDPTCDPEAAAVDWNAVAARVGRTADECCRAFIEADYLSSTHEDEEVEGGAADVSPFGEHPHPTLTTLAFLAAVAEPAVVARCAEAATAALAAAQPQREDAEDASGDEEDAEAEAEAEAADQAAAVAAMRMFRRQAAAGVRRVEEQLANEAHQVVLALLQEVQVCLNSLDNFAVYVEEQHWHLQESQAAADRQATDALSPLLQRVWSDDKPLTQKF